MTNVLSTAAVLGLLWGAAAFFARGLARLDVPESVRRLCGLGVLSLLGFVACAVGFAPRHASEIQPLIGDAFIVIGVVGLGLAWRGPGSNVLRGLPKNGRLALAIVGAILLVSLPWTQMPPFRVDETAYHLAVPALYLERGGFGVLYGNIYSGFPGFGEMLFFWPLTLGAESAARAVQILVLVLAVWATLELVPAERRASVLWAWVVFVSFPVVFAELPTAYVDVIQTSYEFVGVLCLARLWSKHDAGNSSLLAAAWLLGCAAATKYLAFPVVGLGFVILAFVLRGLRRANRPTPRAPVLLGAVVASAVPVVPWLLKNIVERGNPFFPFALSVFPSPEFTVAQQETFQTYLSGVGPLDGQGAPRFGIDAILHFPQALFFQAKFNTLGFDGVIGPLALLCLVLLVVASRSPARGDDDHLGRFILGYAVFKLVLWLDTSWQLRFALGFFLAVAWQVPIALGRLRQVWLRGLFVLAGVGAAVFGWSSLGDVLPRLDRRAFGGAAGRTALRIENHPDSVLCDRTRQISPMKVLLIWSQRLAYWCAPDQVSPSIDEAAPLTDWLEKGGSEGAVRGMRSLGITHLLVDEGYFFALPPGLSTEERTRLERVFDEYRQLKARHLEAVAASNGRTLYALKAEASTVAP